MKIFTVGQKRKITTTFRTLEYVGDKNKGFMEVHAGATMERVERFCNNTGDDKGFWYPEEWLFDTYKSFEEVRVQEIIQINKEYAIAAQTETDKAIKKRDEVITAKEETLRVKLVNKFANPSWWFKLKMMLGIAKPLLPVAKLTNGDKWRALK